MADKILLVDETTGRYKRGGTPFAAPVDHEFNIGAGGVTEVTVAGGITGSQVVDVYVNGKLDREGASHDYVRNTIDGKIEFNYTVPENAWVRVRLH